MQQLKLKMGEMEITTKHGMELVVAGLGSSIGMGVYDRKSRMAGMAHIVLPDSSISTEEKIQEEYGKFADTAVPAILERMLSLGSQKEDLIIKIAGGANMFNLKEDSNILSIGTKNTIAVKQAVESLGLHISRADTGGYVSRTFKLNILNGKFYLKTIGKEEVEF